MPDRTPKETPATSQTYLRLTPEQQAVLREVAHLRRSTQPKVLRAVIGEFLEEQLQNELVRRNVETQRSYDEVHGLQSADDDEEEVS